MYTPVVHTIRDHYVRFKDDVRALLLGIYPAFVYRDVPRIPIGEIPVFNFHYMEPERFERQLRYLSENGYRTISAEEFHSVVTGRTQPTERSVVLTFDDGRGSLWSVAYPLLRRYGLHGICFILPGIIEEGDGRNPTLEDCWSGRVSIEKIGRRDAEVPFCTWKEIEEMQASGAIDFQSHTSYHHTVFISDRLVDFVNPKLQPTFLNGSLNPVTRQDGGDRPPGDLEFGFPIYESRANARAATRYLEDERVSDDCVRYVRAHGGATFFSRSDWRKDLKRVHDRRKRDSDDGAKFQSAEERRQDIRKDLAGSRAAIEARLKKPVTHLCYPWFEGSETAVAVSREVGYVCNHWGIRWPKAVNRVGDDPYYVKRLNDIFVFSLPGNGRMSLRAILEYKFRKTIKGQR